MNDQNEGQLLLVILEPEFSKKKCLSYVGRRCKILCCVLSQGCFLKILAATSQSRQHTFLSFAPLIDILHPVIIYSADKGWLNPPLRFDEEPCRHKALDLIGDLSLFARCGSQGLPVGHVVAYKVFNQFRF